LWLNGTLTVDYTETDEKIERSGIIGLQVHGRAKAKAMYKEAAMFVLRGHEKPVYDIAFSPDGVRLASIGMDQFCMWDIHARTPLWRGNRNNLGHKLAFAADGTWLAVNEVDIGIYNATDGKRQLSLLIPRGAIEFALSPDGIQLAVALCIAPPGPNAPFECFR
jgi:WD40 repeat protein